MTSKLLASKLAEQVDVEQDRQDALAALTAEDVGAPEDAFILPRDRSMYRDPSEHERLSAAVNLCTELRHALAIQRGVLRSERANDPVLYNTPQAQGLEREYTCGEYAVKLIPTIRKAISETEAECARLIVSLTRQGYRFGNDLQFGDGRIGGQGGAA